MNDQKSGNYHILVAGSGSVGKRHAQNLFEMGCRISCCDPRSDRREELSGLINDDVAAFPDIKDALKHDRYDGVVIGSPTSFHVEQAVMALKSGIPVLMEKPLSVTLDDALELRNVVADTGVPLLMGYTWRWWKPLHRVRSLLSDGKLGNILYVQLYMSAHLADWHPWERYQDFFMAKKELGGGALLDESHWIDLMVWFFGMPEEVIGKVEKLSALEIDSDDNVDVLASYQDGKRVYVHLDIYGRPHERFIRFVGENGSIYWSSDPNQIRISIGDTGKQQIEEFQCERNDMFNGVAKEFLSVIGGKKEMACSIHDGINAMKLIEAIRKSSKSGIKETIR